ncbi:MFS transporter [Kitasatospora sp. NPDC001574]
MGVRLVVVDDHRLLAEALATALQLRGHRVLAVGSPAGSAADLVAGRRPEVCLLGVSAPADPGAFEGLRRIRRERPEVAVIVLGPVGELRGVAGAFAAGAAGYVPSDERIEVVERAIARARAGEAAVTVEVLRGAFDQLLRPAAEPDDEAVRLLRLLVLTFLATGVIFGSLELTTVAYADALGRRPVAGVLLGLVAAGSCVAGLAFGTLRPRRAPGVRFLWGVAAMAGLLLLPLAAGLGGAGLALLGAALFVAGTGTAPTMVTGMTLIQELLPRRQLNEAMAIAVSGILVGISAGSSLAGVVAEQAGPGAGFWLPAGAASLALLIALAGRRHLGVAGVAAPADAAPETAAVTAPEASEAPTASGKSGASRASRASDETAARSVSGTH